MDGTFDFEYSDEQSEKGRIKMKDEAAYTLKEMGWDKVPVDSIDKSMFDLMDLHGRVVAITGAGGPCLGQALCNRVASLGADIILIGRHEGNTSEVAKHVAEKWGVETHVIVGNLMDFDDTKRVMDEAWAIQGKVDALINNANFSVGGLFQDFTEEMIRQAVDGPYTSIINCCRHASTHMIPQGYGKIINISSESSQRSDNSSITIYAASKAGVNGLTRSLAHELAPYGITVNAVAPGVMFKKSLRDMFENPDEKNLGIRKAMVGTVNDTILGRVSLPEEVANTVAFLCTDAASYIAGQVIFNGGGSVV